MHMIKKMFFFNISLFLLFVQTLSLASGLMLGTIQFERPAGPFEDVPLYYGGHIIKKSINKRRTRVTFEILKERFQREFLLLVTAEITPVNKVTADGSVIFNTIDYLKVAENQTYKLYRLRLASKIVPTKNQKSEVEQFWIVDEIELPADGRILDNTIIVLYLPEMVEKIEGGSAIELPTIYMYTSKSFDTTNGIEERLLKMHLSALDTNTIHIPIKKMIAWDDKKIIIALE